MRPGTLAIAEEQSLKPYRSGNIRKGMTPQFTVYRARKFSHVSGTDSTKHERESLAKAVTGFVLLDGCLRPISFNAEALTILSYPQEVRKVANGQVFLEEKIRSILVTSAKPGELYFLTEIRSGRRRYFCRALVMDSGAGLSEPTIAVLLDRGPSGLVSLPQVAQQFNLTERERDVLGYLLQAMSNQEIADRLKLRTNTVKSFLRLLMIKTRASSRSMIVARILVSTPAAHTQRPS
jgi:DNA-binding CsgD family transcriptional regulator